MESILDTNSRQANLIGDFTNSKAIIIGVGGAGNWVAMDCALVGFGVIEIYDPDKVEFTNLNRTLFRHSDVGRLKVDALEELIYERRPLTTVVKHPYKLSDVKETTFKNAYVFDCTDTMTMKKIYISRRDDVIMPFTYTKIGYDGFSITWDMLPFEATFGEDNSYRITDSIFSAAQIVAALAVQMVISKQYRAVPEKKRLITLDINQILTDKINVPH